MCSCSLSAHQQKVSTEVRCYHRLVINDWNYSNYCCILLNILSILILLSLSYTFILIVYNVHWSCTWTLLLLWWINFPQGLIKSAPLENNLFEITVVCWKDYTSFVCKQCAQGHSNQLDIHVSSLIRIQFPLSDSLYILLGQTKTQSVWKELLQLLISSCNNKLMSAARSFWKILGAMMKH